MTRRLNFASSRDACSLQEHQAVIKALDQLDPNRKCFRLVGEVLVERTVQEVLPAVKNNAEQLQMVSNAEYTVNKAHKAVSISKMAT